MRNVHQIHLQLIVGGGVILAIHLCITGQTSLCLQAQRKLRHLLAVLCGDLRALRTWAHNRQITLQDVQQLRQLVQAAGADNVTDLCNTVILVAGGETCHAILFCIHAHGAELQNLKLLAVLGQTHLLIEGGATIGLDCNGCDQEQRAQDDQCQQ